MIAGIKSLQRIFRLSYRSLQNPLRHSTDSDPVSINRCRKYSSEEDEDRKPLLQLLELSIRRGDREVRHIYGFTGSYTLQRYMIKRDYPFSVDSNRICMVNFLVFLFAELKCMTFASLLVLDFAIILFWLNRKCMRN